MLNVRVQTITSPRMNTAAAANTGGHRAAGQISRGKTRARGTTVNQLSVGQPKPIALARASTASINTPSTSSGRSGRSRRERMSSMIRGATVTTPMASEANQLNQVVTSGAW